MKRGFTLAEQVVFLWGEIDLQSLIVGFLVGASVIAILNVVWSFTSVRSGKRRSSR